MISKIRNWNRYGFEEDVIDKYRDAVARSNRGAIKVLSVMGIVSAILTFAYGFTNHQPMTGAYFCGFVLMAGIFAAVMAFRSGTPDRPVLVSGYLLVIALHLLSIFGAANMNTDAFWIGTQIAAGCYLLDYAWHIGLVQLGSYALLILVWIMNETPIDGTRILFSLVYFPVSLVTFYTLNHTRFSLILSREQNRQRADTDLLTGLTMRTAAQEEIEEHLKTDEHGVLILLDLDRFKSINDRLGHQMGDRVLIEVAADLKNMFRNSDVLSRLGGDEFVVYMKSVPEREWAQQRADHVVREVRRWVGNGTTNIQITASVGIVMTDMVNRTYDDLYRAADIAMYSAKADGGNKALFYTPEMPDQREMITTGEEIR